MKELLPLYFKTRFVPRNARVQKHSKWSVLERMIPGKVLLSLLFTIFLSIQLWGQTSSGQFWTKYRFSHSFGNQWASELDFSGRFTNTPEHQSIFSIKSRFDVQGWVHYHYSARWRFSAALAYFNNFYLPEIEQKNSKEFRLSLQCTYFFHKIGYTFNTRGRAEFRNIQSEENSTVNAFRYRQQVKYQKPINSKTFRKGVFYLLATDEVFFRINNTQSQNSFFDRNRMQLGGGYGLTDNLQIELTYVNEFFPRQDGSKVTNALSATLTFNNLVANFRQNIRKNKQE